MKKTDSQETLKGSVAKGPEPTKKSESTEELEFTKESEPAIEPGSTNEQSSIDTRPLYQRLKEQKARAHAEELERIKERNKTATLREEDVAYLEEVERRKRERELQIKLEDDAQIEAFKKAKRPFTSNKIMSKAESSLDDSYNRPFDNLNLKRASFGIISRRKPSRDGGGSSNLNKKT